MDQQKKERQDADRMQDHPSERDTQQAPSSRRDERNRGQDERPRRDSPRQSER